MSTGLQHHAHDESSNRGASSQRSSQRSWFHFWFSTFGTWLRGDRRGFRDHDHRIHSSGDYHNPPPAEEHAGLRRWTLEHLHKDPVRLTVPQRSKALDRLIASLQSQDVELLALAVSADHVHGLGRFPDDQARAIIGNAKRSSSHALRAEIPGTLWAKKCALKPIRSASQQRATFDYIVKHADQGASIWTFRDAQRARRAPQAPQATSATERDERHG